MNRLPCNSCWPWRSIGPSTSSRCPPAPPRPDRGGCRRLAVEGRIGGACTWPADCSPPGVRPDARRAGCGRSPGARRGAGGTPQSSPGKVSKQHALAERELVEALAHQARDVGPPSVVNHVHGEVGSQGRASSIATVKVSDDGSSATRRILATTVDTATPRRSAA